MNIDSYESLKTRIGRLRLRRCGSTPALTIFVVYASILSHNEEELDALCMDMELCREDHSFFKVIVGDFNPKIYPRRTAQELHVGTREMEWNEQGERLSEFIMSTQLSMVTGISRIPRTPHRWTWESSGGQFHNEIDHIIFTRRFCLTVLAVAPKFYTGPDHCLLGARFRFSAHGERAMKFRKPSPRTSIN
ncbi:unnamed protein product [Haemonchus placei]|uniref:Endo/exonuclease/phosphatase domain-containing protein n=1 Tax=Haemonchus placei TaxID=6290 RepID=A0A0N4VT65_HAEPC|nr:unnamed protein product [Haemonchus placei]